MNPSLPHQEVETATLAQVLSSVVDLTAATPVSETTWTEQLDLSCLSILQSWEQGVYIPNISGNGGELLFFVALVVN